LLFAATCAVCTSPRVARAVDGISVTTHVDGGINGLYFGYGEIWRHDVDSDAVVAHTKLADGPARHPVISPDGTRVAFITQDGRLQVLSINGGTPTTIATPGGNFSQGTIDWPVNDWVYYNRGNREDTYSKDIYRIHPDGTGGMAVMSLNAQDGTDATVWHFAVAPGLNKIVVRMGEQGFTAQPWACVTAVDADMATANGEVNAQRSRSVGQSEGDGWRCGEGMDPSGARVMMSPFPHESIEIRKWSDLTKETHVYWSVADAWAPDSAVDTGHTHNLNRWSRNSSDWVCICVGWTNAVTWYPDDGCNQMLVNWADQKRIVVTRNTQGGGAYDSCGDFWIGTLAVTPVLTSIDVTPASATIEVGQSRAFTAQPLDQFGDPVAATVTWTASGGGSMGGSTFVSDGGSTGSFTVTASSGAVHGTATVSVSAIAPVLTDIIVVPSSATILTGGTQSFSAQPLDQFGNPCAATVSWDVDAGGSMSGSTFVSDGSSTGTFTVTASSGSVSGSATVTVNAPVAGGSVTLMHPVGGETLYAGTTRYIEWVTDGIDNVTIYSTLDGTTWDVVCPSIIASHADWGRYPWTVPTTTTTTCQVLVASYADASDGGTSAPFSIVAITDADGDGMDDGWETLTFGDMDQNSATDFDGDGLSDRQEFVDGTDPLVGDGAGEAALSLSCVPTASPAACAAPLGLILVAAIALAFGRS